MRLLTVTRIIGIMLIPILFGCQSDLEKAQDPNTSSEDLLSLLAHENSEVRKTALLHSNLPDEELIKVAGRQDLDLKMALFQRDYLLVPCLKILSKDPNYKIRCLVAGLPNDSIVLRGIEAGQVNTPELLFELQAILDSMGTDADSNVLLTLCSNPQLSPETLRKLALSQESDPKILIALAGNSSTPLSTFFLLQKKAELIKGKNKELADQLDRAVKKSLPHAAPLEVGLLEAINKGMIKVKVTGAGLESIGIEIESQVEFNLEIEIQPGILFYSNSSSTQNMISTGTTTVTVEPELSVSTSVNVACTEMDKDTPESENNFTVGQASKVSDLYRLVNCPKFSNATFRVQQYSVWTITDNPATYEYVGLTSGFGFDSFGSEPSEDEFNEIKTLIKECGINPYKYEAFK